MLSASGLALPCAPTQLELMNAVLSKVPPGSLISADQLRSMMGLYAQDMCGSPLRAVGGSFDIALDAIVGGPAKVERPRQQGKRKPRSSSVKYLVPATQWVDPRPPPALQTVCLGEIIEGSTTWLTNDAMACDELVAEHFCSGASQHVGLDCEWTPMMVRGQQQNVALVQLATRQHCVLLRVGQMRPPMPPHLRELLASPTILKVCSLVPNRSVRTP